MSEYLEWRQEGGPLVSVHRRVIAGLEHEPATEFGGVLLGTLSPEANEVSVQDFARLDPGMDWGAAGVRAGPSRHSLPAVGCFRMTQADEVRMTDEDRELL